ncbi:MAG: ParB/RepB/Spo0J family partition protein [Ruminococcaceae bacterium]|nr:ParB/RepB/Spo0J family partition protein [Oscillospiraceae bacterium]
MRWDGKAYADIVKKSVYAILFSTEIPQAATMGNKEYAAFLKSHHYDMGKLYPDKHSPDIKANSSGIKIIFKDRYLNNAGDNSIELTWSMAARHIRAWEYEKAHDSSKAENTSQNTLSPVQEQWEKTHLCGGSVYVEGHCEYLIEPTEDTVINGKEVKKCNPYCTSENKVRKIGTGGLWTGLSPKFCPKRKALEQKNDEPTESDIALFEQYKEEFGRACRFEKVCGSEHKYAKQHWERAKAVYNEIVNKGLEQAYKKYREEKRKPLEEEENMARKFQFDAAITKDMKSAASDSFVDNIKMIEVSEIVPNKENFYEISSLELLADDIEREGLKHNLVVSKDKASNKYWLKSGHRRFAAIKLLISEKRLTSTKVPCLVDGEKTQAESKLDLIMLNATQRKYTDAEVMSEYEQLSQTLKELDDEGKGLGGRMRENIAKILNISNGQVGKLDNIKHNAAPEVKKAVESGKMSISTANEVAKLAPEKQKEVIEKKPDISSAEVKKMQDKKPVAPTKPSSPAPKAEPADRDYDDTDDWDDDNPDLDDDSSDDDFEEETADSTSEKKSSLVLSLILSENEANTLLRFFYSFRDDYGAVGANDAAELSTIKSKLQTLCGK